MSGNGRDFADLRDLGSSRGSWRGNLSIVSCHTPPIGSCHVKRKYRSPVKLKSCMADSRGLFMDSNLDPGLSSRYTRMDAFRSCCS